MGKFDAYFDPDNYLPSFDYTCVDDLEKEIKELNQGRNLPCWPLCSFGWKDADLDPEGCTGIKEVAEVNDEYVWFVVGGHKAFFPSEQPESGTEMTDQDWLEHSIITDFPFHCEWDGDDRWMASFEETVKVAWVFSDETGDLDVKATAAAAVEACRLACEPFSKACADTVEQLDRASPGDES